MVPPPRTSPGCRLQGQYPLPSLPSGLPPLPLPRSAACQQQVVGSAEALCGATLAKCIALISWLKRASASPAKRRTIYDIFIPPPTWKKKCGRIAVSAERRDQCQVRSPLAIPRTPRHPERRTTPLQAAEPMVRRDHRTCSSRK